MSLRIEWDVYKEQANRKKHRVSFSEASEIFLDPLIASVLDVRHRLKRCGSSALG